MLEGWTAPPAKGWRRVVAGRADAGPPVPWPDTGRSACGRGWLRFPRPFRKFPTVADGTALDEGSDVTDTSARVLVADDQPDVVAALRLLLRSAGYDVQAAGSVTDVHARLADGGFDAVLMD